MATKIIPKCLIYPHLIQSLAMVYSSWINEIKHPVMYPHVLCKGIAAKIHDRSDGASFQVNAFQGVDAIINEKSIEFLSRHIVHHFLLPASVGFHFAVPFTIFVEGQGVALHFVAHGIEDDRLMVGVGKEVKLVVNGINGVVNWVGDPKIGANSSGMQ